jgi:hypothetical protein
MSTIETSYIKFLEPLSASLSQNGTRAVLTSICPGISVKEDEEVSGAALERVGNKKEALVGSSETVLSIF